MSRLNYIFSRHRTQIWTFALVCLFAPDLVWQDIGDLLGPNYLQTLKAGGRESLRNLEKYHVSVLKIILGDASRAHRLLHDNVGYSTVLMLCMLSIACPNVLIDETFFPEFHSDLISDNIFFPFLRER